MYAGRCGCASIADTGFAWPGARCAAPGDGDGATGCAAAGATAAAAAISNAAMQAASGSRRDTRPARARGNPILIFLLCHFHAMRGGHRDVNGAVAAGSAHRSGRRCRHATCGRSPPPSFEGDADRPAAPAAVIRKRA
jgi:hypothetical protein